MVQNRILAKLNLWMVYNPGFLAYSLTSYDQSLPKYPGLYTILKYFKKFIFFHNTSPYVFRMV